MLGYTFTTIVAIGNGVVTNTHDSDLRTGLCVEANVRFVVSDEKWGVVGYCMTTEARLDQDMDGSDS